MKKSISLVLVIIAAMVTFAGCVKQETDALATAETKTVQFVAESIETKTTFGTPDGATYPTLWTENDKKIKLLLNLNEEFGADINVADDFTSASFSVDVEIENSVDPYQFCAISPFGAYLGKNDVRFAVTIPTSQTPLENSVDEEAQILYALSGSFDELPETVALNFKHFTAYGKLSFKNLDLGGANVTSVAITSSVNFANRWNCFIADESFSENSGASTITLNTSATENLWFACAPVGEMNGKTLTFTINTDKGTFSKTVTLGEKHKFEAGKIAKMTVDMAGVTLKEPEVYELVTDESNLTVGSKIIIVASEYDYALSTTQNSNNRAQAVVTKSDDKSTITDPGNDVQVLTIGDGSEDETISLSTGEKYLYAPGGGNNLKETTNINANASWTVSIAEGVTTIKAKINNKNWLRYNSTSSIFSCYDSGQKDVSIYKLQGTGTAPLPKLAAPVVTAELNDDETGIDVSWTEVENATSYVISGIGDNVTTTETSYSFTELSSGTYTVSVKAVAEGYRSATGTAGAVTVPVASSGGEEPELPAENNVAMINVASINAVKGMGTGSYGDYKDTDVPITIDGLQFNANNICANSKDGTLKMAAKQFIQVKGNGGYIYNTGGKVKSVKVWTHPSKDNGKFMYIGSESSPTSQVTLSSTTESVQLNDNNGTSVSTTLNVYEVNLDGDNSYFNIKPSSALWIYKLEITYSN